MIFVPSGVRCYCDHFFNKKLTHNSIQNVTSSKSDYLTLNSNEVQNMIDYGRLVAANVRTFDFDDPNSLFDETYFNITGLQKGIPFLK